MRISIFSLFLFPILLANSEFCEGKVTVLSAPANSLYTRIDPDGTTIIPNGRFVRPLGKTVRVAPHPFGLELSRDGNTAITANSGVDPLSISIIRNLQSDQPEIDRSCTTVWNARPPEARSCAGMVIFVRGLQRSSCAATR